MTTPDRLAAEEYAKAYLKKLTPWMSNKERDKLVVEGRSETYKTIMAAIAWRDANPGPEVLALHRVALMYFMGEATEQQMRIALNEFAAFEARKGE